MPADRATVDRLRRLLAGRPGVVEKRMVGGISFSVEGAMACGVTGDALMIRVGKEARDEILKEPHVRPMVFGGRTLSGFICVDAAGFATDQAPERWLRRAVPPPLG